MKEVDSCTANPRRHGGAGASSCAVVGPQGSMLLRGLPGPQNVGSGKGKEGGKRRGRKEEERDREKTVLEFLN